MAFFPPSRSPWSAHSTRPGTVGNDIFRNLLFCGFNGPVYPINPKATNVMGVSAYPSLTSVPGPVDLAVLIVPASAVLGVVDEAIAKKVHGLVVISAGFKEIGHEGAVLEDTLREKVRGGGHSPHRSELPGRDQHPYGCAV